MRKDPGITVSLTISEALKIGGALLRLRWPLLLLFWLLTGFGALLLQDLLLPRHIAWYKTDGSVLALFIIFLLAARLLSFLGLLTVAKVSGQYALGEAGQTALAEIKGAIKLLGGLLVTGLVSLLRILLVVLGSMPIVLLLGFLLYGAAQGALAAEVEQAVVAAPILLFAVVGFARFGWSVYFTLLRGAGPREALRKSKSLFAHNPNTVWTLTGIVLIVPLLTIFLPSIAQGALIREVYRSLRYVSSLWSFAAGGLVATIIARTTEEGESKPISGA